MIKRILGVLLLVFLFYYSNAQGPAGPPPANPVPITGIEVLIGAGALLGIKRFLGKKKE